MDYNLEALGDEGFQKLCQAVLAATYPNVQSLPVGQPDGGRDAFARHEGGGFNVFQVKFSRNPSLKTERDAVAELIASETEKVSALIKRGATSYYFMTNVSGTAHPDTGSIDRINDQLSQAFGVPTMCWWRGDIERRIDITDGLVWRFPTILRATDFLEVLGSRNSFQNSKQAFDAFKAYMRHQYARDSEVKFQQVQIQNNLLDLFTDTPIALAREKQPKPSHNSCGEDEFDEIQSAASHARPAWIDPRSGTVRAADWMLRAAPQSGLQKIVLEGAPGQGKSTVTQYICQINRIRSLKEQIEPGKVPESHLSNVLRLPMRVDLRDYSTWLAGFDPFAGSKAVPRPSNAIDTLESFIAHQIRYLSGGLEFTVDTFISLLRGCHCLIVLDGFDEVADIPTRAKIIDQTKMFGIRIQDIVTSAQLIVTSRPNAFILSAGFAEREWMHLSLRPLQLFQISEYADKWIAAKELSTIKGLEFKELLGDRVSRPHIRSLAQNPMQLAILLNLINTKGLSLPDKRTALYESYMDLFFGREAEKDEVVRENRDVLMQIHEYVAWLLQTDAERPGGAGSMTQESLEEVVKSFIEKKGHDVDVLSLFQGAVERVGALVSRVQGMLEFEVQPLREYFTGRYLYTSAPYSTLLSERGGTRPQRFAALAKRPYWSNVARFYAGCYNSGELASLLVGLQEIRDSSDEKVGGNALQLGLLLLSDWVFAQEPRIVSSVVDFLTEHRNMKTIVAHPITWEDNRTSLPSRCARVELGKASIKETLNSFDAAYVRRVGSIAIANSSYKDRLVAWKGFSGNYVDRLNKAVSLGLFVDTDRNQLDEFIAEFKDDAIIQTIRAGQWNELSPGEIAIALEKTASRLAPDHVQNRYGGNDKELALFRALWMLNPSNYRILHFDFGPDVSFGMLLHRYGMGNVSPQDIDSSAAAHLGLADFLSACDRSTETARSSWIASLKPWSDIVESARRTWGDTIPVMTLAASAAGIQSKTVRASEFDELLNTDLPMAERARHGRLRNSVSWWLLQFKKASSDNELFWLNLVAVCWASGPILGKLSKLITRYVDDLDIDMYEQFSRAVHIVMALSPGGKPKLTGMTGDTIAQMPSAKLAFLLSSRLSFASRRKAVIALTSRDDATDLGLVKRLTAWLLAVAHQDTSLWETTLRYVAKNRDFLEHNVFNDPEFFGVDPYSGRSGMPKRTADTIIRSMNNVPMLIIEAAASTYYRSESMNNKTINEVAAEERWFEAA